MLTSLLPLLALGLGARAQTVVKSWSGVKATAYYDLEHIDKCIWTNGGPWPPQWYNTVNGGYTACQGSTTAYTLDQLGSNRIVAMDLNTDGKGPEYWCGKEVQIFGADGEQIILDEGPFVVYDNCGGCGGGNLIDVSAKAFVQIKGGTCGGDNPTRLTVKVLDRNVSPSGKPGAGAAATTSATTTKSSATAATTTLSTSAPQLTAPGAFPDSWIDDDEWEYVCEEWETVSGTSTLATISTKVSQPTSATPATTSTTVSQPTSTTTTATTTTSSATAATTTLSTSAPQLTAPGAFPDSWIDDDGWEYVCEEWETVSGTSTLATISTKVSQPTSATPATTSTNVSPPTSTTSAQPTSTTSAQPTSATSAQPQPTTTSAATAPSSTPSRITDPDLLPADNVNANYPVNVPADCTFGKYVCDGRTLKICNYVTWRDLGWQEITTCPHSCTFKAGNQLECI